MFKLGLIVAVLALSTAQTTTTSAPYTPTAAAHTTTSARYTTTAAAPTTTAAPPPSTVIETPTAIPDPTPEPAPVATTAVPAPSTAEPVPPSTAAPTTYQPATTTANRVYTTTRVATTVSPPAPCSSDAFSLMGKCGGPEHAYLRCPKGYWCSQWGYCGTSKEYRTMSLCPQELREDPPTNATKLGLSPDDKAEDYLVQDDLEAEHYDKDKTWKNCQKSQYHRWGKCGTKAHGNFRCKYGEWCTKWGYCSKYAGAAKDALCPREPRRHPKVITYTPAPDDDPDYVEVVPTTRRKHFRTTKTKSKL